MSKIELEREKCIGCGLCQALCPKYFKMIEDGKSHIIGSDNNSVEELEVEKVDCASTAADSCPVQCIHITK